MVLKELLDLHNMKNNLLVSYLRHCFDKFVNFLETSLNKAE